jgi:hypothetical protein
MLMDGFCQFLAWWLKSGRSVRTRAIDLLERKMFDGFYGFRTCHPENVLNKSRTFTVEFLMRKF